MPGTTSDLTPLGDTPPVEQGLADFALVWSNEAQDFAVADAPDLPAGFAAAFGSISFSGFADIDGFFKQRTGASFIGWFNGEVANRGAFAQKSIAGACVDAHFRTFWDSYARENPVTLTEFVAYMSIFINERNGDLASESELFGMKSHPGIAYLFDSFVITTSGGRQFRKASYNQPPNKLAGALFKDAEFNAAHGALPLGDRLKESGDAVWSGTTYPQGPFPVSGDPNVTGYLLQADFFKFRGRGLIQTTWRNNYADLVQFVRAYDGPNARLKSYRNRWNDLSPDSVCTRSTTQDWDDLFQNTDNEVVCAAIRGHAKAGGYMPLAKTDAELNAVASGSLAAMGTRIGGSAAYGAVFKSRVRQICVTLGK